jgi:hypothetical protein
MPTVNGTRSAVPPMAEDRQLLPLPPGLAAQLTPVPVGSRSERIGLQAPDRLEAGPDKATPSGTIPRNPGTPSPRVARAQISVAHSAIQLLALPDLFRTLRSPQGPDLAARSQRAQMRGPSAE